MEFNSNLSNNFTRQLKFLTIVLSLLSIIFGILPLNLYDGFYFFITLTCMVITLVVFLATALIPHAKGARDDSLRKLEINFHITSAVMMTAGVLLGFFGLWDSYSHFWHFELCSILIGVLNAPLNFLIGWQLYGAKERELAKFRAFYLCVNFFSFLCIIFELLEDRDGFTFNFIVVWIVLLVTILVFLLSIVVNIVEDLHNPTIRRFEGRFHTLGGLVIIMTAVATLASGLHTYYPSEERVVSCLVGVFLNGPINLMIGWILKQESKQWVHEQKEPNQILYFQIIINHDQIKHGDIEETNLCTRGYSSALLDGVITNRSREPKSVPIVPLPKSHSLGTSIN